MKSFLTSKKLSKLNLNITNDKDQLYTYWCRVVYAEFEKWNCREHAHSFWELHLCLSGSACIMIDGIKYTLTENTFMFFCPKCKHTILFESNDYSEFVWGFSVDNNHGINEILIEKYKKPDVFGADTQIINSVFRILENTEKSEYGYYDIIKNELYHIFVILSRKVGIESKDIYHKAQNNEAELIRKYVCDNLSGDITTDDVALLFCISKSSVERICKKEFNKTFSQMKSELRAAAIRELLQQTNCTMEEIADATGFSDRYSMGKFFKKVEGQSPGEYRRGTKK